MPAVGKLVKPNVKPVGMSDRQVYRVAVALVARKSFRAEHGSIGGGGDEFAGENLVRNSDPMDGNVDLAGIVEREIAAHGEEKHSEANDDDEQCVLLLEFEHDLSPI